MVPVHLRKVSAIPQASILNERIIENFTVKSALLEKRAEKADLRLRIFAFYLC